MMIIELLSVGDRNATTYSICLGRCERIQYILLRTYSISLGTLVRSASFCYSTRRSQAALLCHAAAFCTCLSFPPEMRAFALQVCLGFLSILSILCPFFLTCARGLGWPQSLTTWTTPGLRRTSRGSPMFGGRRWRANGEWEWDWSRDFGWMNRIVKSQGKGTRELGTRGEET